MVKKIINRVNEWLEDGLRGLLGRLTPDRRVILVAAMLLLFSGLSIYMTVSSIYNLGKDKGRRLEVERIEAVKLQREESRPDSIHNSNDYNDGTGENN